MNKPYIPENMNTVIKNTYRSTKPLSERYSVFEDMKTGDTVVVDNYIGIEVQRTSKDQLAQLEYIVTDLQKATEKLIKKMGEEK